MFAPPSRSGWPSASQSVMSQSQNVEYEDGDFCTPADQPVEEVSQKAGEPSPFHKKSRSCFGMSTLGDSLDTDTFNAHRAATLGEALPQQRGGALHANGALGCGSGGGATAPVPIFENPFAAAAALLLPSSSSSSGGGAAAAPTAAAAAAGNSRKRAAAGRFSKIFDQENRARRNGGGPSLLRVPRHMRDFHELSVCGDGHFSKVWKARGRLDGAAYALKSFKNAARSDAAKKIALREVHALAALGSHPHIVRYYAAWMEEEKIFIQFELCPRGSLWDSLQRWSTAPPGATNPVGDALIGALLRDISSALAHMHARGIVHLDIKPHNVLLGDGSGGDGSGSGGWSFKLADFGHASAAMSDLDVEQGDVRYLALDLLQAQEGATLTAGDVFSLGATAYEAACGSFLPAAGYEWQRIRDGDLRPTRCINRGLRRCLELMLHPQPTARPSAAQLHAHLQTMGGGGAAAAAAGATIDAGCAEAAALRAQCEALQAQLTHTQARCAELEAAVGEIFDDSLTSEL